MSCRISDVTEAMFRAQDGVVCSDPDKPDVHKVFSIRGVTGTDPHSREAVLLKAAMLVDFDSENPIELAHLDRLEGYLRT